MAGLRIRGSSWIFGVNGCNVARRNEKTASRRVLRKPLVLEHLGLQVTGPKRDPATVTPFQSSGIQPHSSSKIPPKPCYRWPQPLALWRVSRDWVQEFVALGALRSGRTGRLCTRPKRAAAHRSTDTHTGRHEKTGQKAPESHQEAFKSGRCGVGWWCSFRACRGAAGGWKRHPGPIV